MKDEHQDTLFDCYHQVNTLPTYDNMFAVYNELQLPPINQMLLVHKKEQMVFMIINMVRTSPKLYIHALGILQDRCSQR
jgi:hypothetical protein